MRVRSKSTSSAAGTHRSTLTYLSFLLELASWRLWLILGLALVASGTEWIGLLLLVPLLQVVGVDVGHGSVKQVADVVTSVFSTLGVQPTLITVLAVYVAIISLRAALNYGQTLLNMSFQQRLIVRLQDRLYRALVRARWTFFSRSRGSDLIHVLISESNRVGYSVGYLLSVFTQALLGLVYLALAIKLSATLTLLASASGITLMLAMRRQTQAARRLGEEFSAASGQILAAATEHIGGIKTVKSYGAEDRHADLFSDRLDRLAGTILDATRNHAVARFWFNIGSVLILSLILYVSLSQLSLPAGGILLLLLIFSRLVPRFSGIQQSYQSFLGTVPALARVMDLLDECAGEAENEVIGSDAIRFQRAIRLEGVGFGYSDDGRPPAVSELNLEIPARRTTAIVGPSGAGKSTIADLVMGLLLPDAGRLWVDDVHLSPDRVRAWRTQVGYVPQDAVLFHDSIRANLLWAAPHATERELWEALRMAAADGFVSRLPAGLDTSIGDRGVQLSGGERQRLALARALLRRPTLLVLDEATSALDSENERRIREAVETLHGRVTILIIAHRLSTIRDADVIYVLEEGKVAAAGSWDELVVGSERFVSLCRAQEIPLSAVADGAIGRPAAVAGSD